MNEWIKIKDDDTYIIDTRAYQGFEIKYALSIYENIKLKSFTHFASKELKKGKKK